MHENRTYDEIRVGDRAEMPRLCAADDLFAFAHCSGNHNPMHLADRDGDGDGVNEAQAPQMWVASLISGLLGWKLPGPGVAMEELSIRWMGVAQAGDQLVARAEVIAKEAGNRIRLRVEVDRVEDGVALMGGEAVVRAPERKMSFADEEIPGLVVQRHLHFDRLIAEARALGPVTMAVAAPEDAVSLGGALEAAAAGLATPILVGDPAKIAAAAQALGASLDGFEVVEAMGHAQAAETASMLVREGRASTLMKGALHTDDLLRAVLDRDRGLRAGRRLTHVFVMDVPGLPHPLLISDAAINIAPDLETKADIVRNAIDVARAIGIELPKVGVLSAVEVVNPAIPSSVDAALLSKMAERGQITGGLVDGPLAMDNAVDLGAARTKGIKSLVAGQAEVLIAPNLDAGNMIAKELSYIAHAEAAGVVMGARAPIVLTSRADGPKARLASCAVAALCRAFAAGAR
ncbi:bifunctional enoyl-CoA hydratase/phosphate acetyltransferase [Albimonas sp. CAU 1670]|uniref:bifunctional enoyl-CoA hydratase/phosphate acetyltransferase n=1 Tax=Albimonas sp. CAU 1670 TaxID=3032599 RepID=UPI0023DABA7F|nr:bifunctional enoyl-CoA hydratase/phosphate acetyltransferase [Albimonas sp. CAU 1670]MDF2234287.1 bifunctional enoyl-CoA hydratase/phosphate acetyltransferase [Albimonas sp. CAU 1670]